MIGSMQALWNEWQYARSIGISFLSNINDVDLQKKFPRENYNTVLEQYNELYEIQQDYVDAIDSKNMQFSGKNLHITSASELMDKMKALDEKLEAMLEMVSGNEYVLWFGNKHNIHQHICAMISHEMMHIGQVVAFCYAVGITIPDDIVETMALDG